MSCSGWPRLRALDFTYSERYDDYSTFGSAAKPKFAIRYKPFNDLTVRATDSEGFVVPSLSQLFGTPLSNFSSWSLTPTFLPRVQIIPIPRSSSNQATPS
jgi:outer membrane receptor protein involved in Fe transport